MGSLLLRENPAAKSPPGPEPKPVARSYIHEVLPVLKPEYAEIIRRVDLEEASRQCVAGELGLTTNNVGVRLHRARRALRVEIEHRHKRGKTA